MAVDGSGNVYIADHTNNRVLKETPSGGIYTESTVASGLAYPEGVAVDGSGNVYIADSHNNRVLKETLSGGAYAESTVASGLSAPYGVTVDGSGNVYTADTGNSRVLKETLSSGTYTESTVESVLTYPGGVMVDGSGNLYIADTGNNRVVKVTAAPPSFGSVAAGSTSSTQTEIFTFDTAGTIAAPAVLTQGATALDFQDASTGSCTTNGTSHTYAAGDTCTLDVTFSPHFAGTRYGAAQLTDSSGNVIATAYLQGTGTGPQVNFLPGFETTIATSQWPAGIAVDGSGNVYMTDSQNPRLLKETLAGNSYTQSVVTSSNLNGAGGIALDGSGNIYIADTSNHRILKDTLSGGGYAESTIGSSTLKYPEGVAVDGSGNVYIADTNNDRVLKEVLANGVYTESMLASSGLNNPQALGSLCTSSASPA